MKKIIWIGVIIAAITVLFIVGRNGGPNIEPPFQAGILHPLDNVKGKTDPTVVVMEYSDFECPACRAYYPLMRELMAEFGGEVAFVYRHFPLIGIHPNAELAARAAEAAAKQGKFWEMHDLLFEKQGEWAKSANVATLFESYAGLLGMSVDQFKTDWISKEIKDFVKAQRIHATRSGLQGTPTFFVAGKQIKNPTSVGEFRTIIKEAMEKNGS